MIPKIIHYCWFGRKPFPKTVEMCISTWKKHLPEYEFMLWNEDNSPMSHPFVQKAYSKGKYAFVSDYIRLWAIFQYGGIYLDTDMYVIKPFDCLISNRVFFGYEDAENKNINAAIIGAIKNESFISFLLEKYNNIKICYDFTEITIPKIITHAYHYYDDKYSVSIYPYNTFYPFPHKKRKTKNFISYATSDTIAIHLWNFSWLSISDKIILRFIWMGKYFWLIKKDKKIW